MSCAICAIAKCENNYINDWVKYHINLGFDRIYLYDNNDSSYEDVMSRIDKNYISYVNVIRINDRFADQVVRYTEFYNSSESKKYDWILYTDIDEFFTITKYDSLSSFLGDPKFNDTEVIKVALKNYGDSGILEGDISIPIYERLLYPSTICNALPSKCLVRSNIDNIIFGSAHFPSKKVNGEFFPTIKQVLVNGEPSNDKVGLSKFIDDVYIRHYMTKTLSEYIEQKFNRTDVRFKKSDICNLDYFFRLNEKTPEKVAYLKSIGINV